MRETWVPSLGWEHPLEKGMATHSSILAWGIPWTYGPWRRKESDMTERLSLTQNTTSKGNIREEGNQNIKKEFTIIKR